MPERPQRIPEEFMEEEPVERPRLRKVYDADEEIKKEKSKAAVSGLKQALSEEGQKERAEREKRARLDKVSKGWEEIEKETAGRAEKERRTKTALKGLREALGKKEEKTEPGEVDMTSPTELTGLEDTLEEMPVYKPDYTPAEQKFFKEGEAMSEANEEAWKDVTFEPGKPSSELAPKPSPGIHGKEYQVANALQEAAYLVGYTARMIAQRFPGIDLETKTLGIIFGRLRFRRARETMPDLFDRYEAEDREYKRLLSEANKII